MHIITYIYDAMSNEVIIRKIKSGDIFSCGDLSNFINTIVQILPFKGASMSRFYICEYDGVRFLAKLCFYRKTPIELYGVASKHVIPHTDAEINILKIFRDKITNKGLTPCILELIYSKICTGVSKVVPGDCEYATTNDSPKGDIGSVMCKYADLVNNGLAHDKYAFLVLDKCDITFDDYLRRSINTPVSIAVFKSLLFQIIYTVYAINKIYPKFRHYDLHTDNIMLKFDTSYKFKANNPKFLIFTIGGVKYAIPYFGIIPKIIDFGFSTLPEEAVISNATEDQVQMYFRSQNDLLFLFHHINYTLTHSGGDKLGRVSKMLRQLEPNQTYIQYYTEHIRRVADKIPSYESMIKNKLWGEYKNVTVLKNQIYTEFTPIEDII